jgi:hypothetical protein
MHALTVRTYTGERWYTISSPELAREVLLPRDDTYVDRFIPGPMAQVNKSMVGWLTDCMCVYIQCT